MLLLFLLLAQTRVDPQHVEPRMLAAEFCFPGLTFVLPAPTLLRLYQVQHWGLWISSNGRTLGFLDRLTMITEGSGRVELRFAGRAPNFNLIGVRPDFESRNGGWATTEEGYFPERPLVEVLIQDGVFSFGAVIEARSMCDVQ